MPEKCKQRREIALVAELAGKVAMVPTLPVGAVRGYLCFHCFSPSQSMIRCSACKRAWYCSEECRKLDWSLEHESQCKILVALNDHEELLYEEKRTWTRYIWHHNRNVTVTCKLDPNLRYIAGPQPYCVTCRRTSVQLYTRGIGLKSCEKCIPLPTCTDCQAAGPSPSHPESACAAYHQFSELELYNIACFEATGIFPQHFTAHAHTTRQMLKENPSWQHYFANIAHPDVNPELSKSATGTYLGAKPDSEGNFDVDMHPSHIWATDFLTMPLTIHAALEKIGWDKPDLHIHLVGATGREWAPTLANHGEISFEELLHLDPNIQNLHITVVGPESLTSSINMGLPRLTVQCCDACKASLRSRTAGGYRGFYHDYVKTHGLYYPRPDLIVLFNSQWCEDDRDIDPTWRPTIDYLLDSGIPVLFTTFTAQEAADEEGTMRRLGGRFVVEPEINPWKGLLPSPEFFGGPEFGFWYRNSHWCIVQGRQSAPPASPQQDISRLLTELEIRGIDELQREAEWEDVEDASTARSERSKRRKKAKKRIMERVLSL